MPEPESWNIIIGADSSPLILSVGFPVTGHREPGFAGAAQPHETRRRLAEAFATAPAGRGGGGDIPL
jgi:hypothetical protein